jgi:hypothetical protein
MRMFQSLDHVSNDPTYSELRSHFSHLQVESDSSSFNLLGDPRVRDSWYVMISNLANMTEGRFGQRTQSPTMVKFRDLQHRAG